MSIWVGLFTVVGTLAVIGGVAFLIFRAEYRKEAPHGTQRSHHDTALGKDGRYVNQDGPVSRRFDSGDAGGDD